MLLEIIRSRFLNVLPVGEDDDIYLRTSGWWYVVKQVCNFAYLLMMTSRQRREYLRWSDYISLHKGTWRELFRWIILPEEMRLRENAQSLRDKRSRDCIALAEEKGEPLLGESPGNSKLPGEWHIVSRITPATDDKPPPTPPAVPTRQKGGIKIVTRIPVIRVIQGAGESPTRQHNNTSARKRAEVLGLVVISNDE